MYIRLFLFFLTAQYIRSCSVFVNIRARHQCIRVTLSLGIKVKFSQRWYYYYWIYLIRQTGFFLSTCCHYDFFILLSFILYHYYICYYSTLKGICFKAGVEKILPVWNFRLKTLATFTVCHSTDSSNTLLKLLTLTKPSHNSTPSF